VINCAQFSAGCRIAECVHFFLVLEDADCVGVRDHAAARFRFGSFEKAMEVVNVECGRVGGSVFYR